MLGAQILLVDDDPWIVRMVTAVLSKRGHRVHTASDGEEGLQKARQLHPDLIISDVLMPKLDGWTLLSMLRSDKELGQTPVLMLTALSADEDRMRAGRLGAVDLLPKPFRFEELDLRVASALRKRGGAQTGKPQLEPQPSKLPPPAAAPEESHAAAPGQSGIHGSLDQLSLGSLLAMIEMERKSGILQLQRGPLQGRLMCRRGQLLSAELSEGNAPRKRGIEVIFQLLDWTWGHFDFTACEVYGSDEINTQITHLLMEGARRMDEARQPQHG